jgi:hypothetical protein
MLIPLLKEKIVPDIVCTVDGSPVIKKFYDDPTVDEYKDRVKAVFSSLTVHPEVVKRCPFEKYWFVNMYDDPTAPTSLTAAFHFMSGRKTILVAGGTVGFFAFNLAYFLGADPIILVGYNYSYNDLDITKSAYYGAYLLECKGDTEKVKKYFSIRTNPVWKNRYLLDLMWQTYREIFAFYVKRARAKVINATGEGSLHPPEVKVECTSLEDVFEKFN